MRVLGELHSSVICHNPHHTCQSLISLRFTDIENAGSGGKMAGMSSETSFNQDPIRRTILGANDTQGGCVQCLYRYQGASESWVLTLIGGN